MFFDHISYRVFSKFQSEINDVKGPIWEYHQLQEASIALTQTVGKRVKDSNRYQLSLLGSNYNELSLIYVWIQQKLL